MVNKLLLIITFSFAIILSGCFGTANYPKRNNYLLLSPKTLAWQMPATEQSLVIDDTNTLSQFSGNEFVYRISEQQFKSDYYARFFISPSEQIHQILMQYLDKAKLTPTLLDAGRNGDLHLASKIVALYADYRKKPQAVLAIAFTLYNKDYPQQPALMTKTYQKHIPLNNNRPNSLIKAWNLALGQILKTLNDDLYHFLKDKNQTLS